jgi:Tol biopolymer transport system component
MEGLSDRRLPTDPGLLLRLLIAAVALSTFACQDTSGPEPIATVEELVFGATGLEGHGDGIFRVGQDGTGVERISDLVPEDLAVSPGGGRVAFITFVPGVSFDIYVLDLEDGTEVLLAQEQVWARGLVWAPDGSRLAYVREARDEHLPVDDVHVVNLDGSEPRRLVAPDSGWATGFAWSPSGERVALSSRWFGGSGVVVGLLDEETSELSGARHVAAGAADALDWHPDETAVVGIGPVDANGNGGVVKMLPDGSGTLSLTPTAQGSFRSSVAYSPDGERIAYVLDFRIVLMNADGTDRSELPLVELGDGARVTAVDWLR